MLRDPRSKDIGPKPTFYLLRIADCRKLAIGTLLSIIRQSGVARAEFEELI